MFFSKEGAMPSLQVRDLPENIYRLLQKNAEVEHRSLAQEAIVTLAKGLETSVSNKERRNKLLADIENQPCSLDNVPSAIDPVSLVKEDRER